MMNAEQSMQPPTVNALSIQFIGRCCNPIFFRRGGIQQTEPGIVKNPISNFYLSGKRTTLFVFVLFQMSLVTAQSTPDSSRATDTALSIPVRNDSVVLKPVIRRPPKVTKDTTVVFYTDTLRFNAKKPADYGRMAIEWSELLKTHPFFNFFGKPIHIRVYNYERDSYDAMFYLLVLMLFYFAVVKYFFGKYLANLLTLFFRASMRQQQLREQVLQSPFPSLLLNNLFVFSGGLYGAFLLRYHYGNADLFWMHFLYCTVFLAVLYLTKFMILRMTGWIFNNSRSAETYLFVVFMTNKIIGIFLLPFLVLISFSGPVISEIAITISLIMIGIFYVYRFLGSYSILHKEIKISGLHFILYLCAFEIAPLLLIYKVLVTYLEKAY
jgi:hypothetical protein